MENEKPTQSRENKPAKKYLWLLLFVLLLLLFGGWLACSRRYKPVAPVAGTPAVKKTSPPPEQKIDLAEQETRELRLNFKDTYLRLTGYPYVDAKYRPRLYNLIYVDTIFAPDDMANLTDPTGKWKDIYEMSTSEQKIYMPFVRQANGPLVWQTMEIIQKNDVAGVLGDCSESDYKLTGDLTGFSYSCPQTETNKETAASAPCYLPVEDGKGILYRQFSSDGSASGNMCEVLKNNYIFAIKFSAD